MNRITGLTRNLQKLGRYVRAIRHLPSFTPSEVLRTLFFIIAIVFFGLFVGFVLNGAAHQREFSVSSPLLDHIFRSFRRLEDIPPRLLLAEFTTDMEEIVKSMEASTKNTHAPIDDTSDSSGPAPTSWKRLNPTCNGKYYTCRNMQRTSKKGTKAFLVKLMKSNIVPDPFPLEFESRVYKYANSWNVSSLMMNRKHYERYGRDAGAYCSTGQKIRDIINQLVVPALALPTAGIESLMSYEDSNDIGCFVVSGGKGRILEIGPYTNPVLLQSLIARVGNEPLYRIEYFDIFNGAELHRRARLSGVFANPAFANEKIDYVDSHGILLNTNLKYHPSEYTLIVSSFILNQQFSLIEHFQEISYLLTNGGYYTMMVPDKRYTFDHYLPESTLPDVLSDFIDVGISFDRKPRHKLSSFISHRALTGHSHTERYWQGMAGRQYHPQVTQRVRNAIEEYEEYIKKDLYVELHNYRFTPMGLAVIVDMLFEMKLTDLHVHRLYETVRGSTEFTIVLKRCARAL